MLKEGITHILTTAEPLFPEDFVYKLLEVHVSSFTEANEFISQAFSAGSKTRVLSDSTFTLAYMMSRMQMDLTQSLKVIAEPNNTFITYLQTYEKKLKDKHKKSPKRFSMKKISQYAMS